MRDSLGLASAAASERGEVEILENKLRRGESVVHAGICANPKTHSHSVYFPRARERESGDCGRVWIESQFSSGLAGNPFAPCSDSLRRCCNRQEGLCDYSERVAEKMPEYCVESSLLARLR
jgi:hypothetical protein